MYVNNNAQLLFQTDTSVPISSVLLSHRITQRSHYYDSWSNLKKNVVYSVSLAEEFYTFC